MASVVFVAVANGGRNISLSGSIRGTFLTIVHDVRSSCSTTTTQYLIFGWKKMGKNGGKWHFIFMHDLYAWRILQLLRNETLN